MRNVLFYLIVALFIGTATGDFFNAAYAEDEDESEDAEDEQADEDSNADSENEDDSAEEERSPKDTQNHVRSIVDSLLKINKHVNSAASASKNKASSEEGEDVDEQIIKLKEDIAALNKNLDKYYAKNKDDAKKAIKKKETKKKSGNRPKRRACGRNNSRKIYTVKNIRLSPNATNKYLRAIRNSTRPSKSYASSAKKPFKSSPRKEKATAKYKIKSWGDGEQAVTTGKFTTKTDAYLKSKSSCSFFSGCSSA
ncbi:MAG: hypothetical protein LBL99_01025 [Holosporaceae bacterium]|jgi:phage host-nuclease inhibitor protein Gam|nr:hypothetical protein [Holosporaceae bacterium]